MQIVSRKTLVAFWEEHPQAKGPIETWYALTKQAQWKSPQEIKDVFGGNVDFVADNRAIFDLGGNKYRLIGHISYTYKSVMVKFIGTHKEYDKIDPETV